MKRIKNIYSIKNRRHLLDVFFVWIEEFRAIFRDPGLRLLFIIAPIAYPILYGFIYSNEAIHDVPIAVVDQSGSELSRKFIRALDATPDVEVAQRTTTLDEAMKLYDNRTVHGVVFIPADFQQNVVQNRQSTFSVLTDMSSFIYYKAVLSASSFVSRDMGIEIQMDRLMADGMTSEQASVASQPFTYSHTPIYNAAGGYASFLLPVIFIIVIFQTLVLGIGMRGGTQYERNPDMFLNRIEGRSQSIFGLMIGRSLAYALLYGVLSFYILVMVPRWFNLPHDGSIATLTLLIIPFLIATIFFAMTISTFIYNRENSMALLLFSSVILVFISGVSWPTESIPKFWRWVGWLLPSTHGVEAYVRVNTMGAPLSAVSFEYLSLWVLSGFYFMTAYLARLIQLHRIKREHELPSFDKK